MKFDEFDVGGYVFSNSTEIPYWRRTPEAVESEFHSHKIVPWAVEEQCYFCGHPASHKVAEDIMGPFHPLTAYVCCNHFWSSCQNTDVYVERLFADEV